MILGQKNYTDGIKDKHICCKAEALFKSEIPALVAVSQINATHTLNSLYWCSVTTLTQCITAAVLCLEQLRGTSRDCSHFQWKFLWQLGAGERGDEGASRTCLCRPACFGRPSRDIPKSPGQSVSQPVNRRLRMSAQLPLVLLRCGGQSPRLRYV